jgi:serine/threonine protein kinase
VKATPVAPIGCAAAACQRAPKRASAASASAGPMKVALKGSPVAVKVIVPAMAADPGQRQYLEHELKVAKSLDHPTIIRIDRFSEEGGLPHLVMEYFPHPNLKKQVQAGIEQLVPRLQRLVTELALALDHVHARGWVHRDVKPENALAAPDGQVQLIDFAIASKASGMLGKLFGGKTPPLGSPMS